MIKVSKFVGDLKTLLTMKTQYNNRYPNNIGKVQPDGTVTFDCWNLIKSLLNGWDINRATEVGYVTPNLNTTGDLNGRQLLNRCTKVSQDFTQISSYPAGTYLFMAETHSGTYVGEFEIDGYKYNVIECTGSWERKVLASWVDPDGSRRHYQGGRKNGAWTHFGLLTAWVDYSDNATPMPTPDAMPIPAYFLRRGNRGSQVEHLQNCLNYLGYKDYDGKELEVDGDWGGRTHASFLSFQRANRLNPDGVYGPLSYSALRQAVNNKAKRGE